jgi:probable phosphoglycerate mutase
VREFIVEADGGSRGNPGPAGYGAVVSDAATGETLREAAEYIGVATNNVAEYRGLLAGLRAAHALDPAATVHVRMDSKLVVEQMSGRWNVKHPAMRPLAAEAARIFPPGRVTYEWIPRERNKHADRLANEAMDAGAKGEQWSESASTADLDLDTADRRAARATAAATPERPEPPGDAAAGAARVREALTAGRAGGAGASLGDGGADDPAAGGGTGVPGAGRAMGAPAAEGEVGVPAAEAEVDTGAAEAGAGTRAAEAGAVGASAATAEAHTPAEAGVATPAPRVEADTPVTAAAAGTRTAESVASTRTAESVAGTRTAESVADTRTADSVGDTRTARSVGDTRAAKAVADTRAATTVASPGWAPADMGAPATFVLLRHGETPLTPQKRFSGSGGTDPSLSDVGREQAERAAAMLARRGTIQAVVSSPLARTRETAGVVAARLGLDVEIEDGLRETDFGAWEGLTFAEVRERHPDDLNAWLASPDAEPTGGGESFAATAERIAATRDKLIAAHQGRTVLLVTHVTPIKTFVRLALGAPAESLFRMELSAASLSVVAYYADGNASVRLLNDTSHLR